MILKKSISAYIINLNNRIDGSDYLLRTFEDRPEFNAHLVVPVEHVMPIVSLWESVQHIIRDLVDDEDEYILICLDDHLFTENYSPENLIHCIEAAQNKQADILLGGVSDFKHAIPTFNGLCWVQNYNGIQFMIVFRQFFDKILNAGLNNLDTVEHKISSLTGNQFVVYPYISVQKEKENAFRKSAAILEHLINLSAFYRDNHIVAPQEAFDEIRLPTYVINLPERTERLEHIKDQFKGRSEFDIRIVEACKHEVGAVGLWLSIRKVIQRAIEDNEELILICEDDHQFTEQYSKEYLFRNIIEAHYQHIDYLSGGTSYVEYAVPVSKDRFWVGSCLATQFIVLYKKIFRQILDKPFDNTVVADQTLSQMTPNKMVIYPFVSVQKDFGYSDVTRLHNDKAGIVQHMFSNTIKKLGTIKQAIERYDD